MSDVQVIHGDCRLILPTLQGIDAVLTDPPYGVKERTKRLSNGRSHATASIDFDAVVGDDGPFEPAHLLGFPRVVLWGGNHYASRLPDSPCWLVWDKRDNGTSDDNADCELAWTNLKRPARLLHHRWRGMIKDSEQNQTRLHPTQKPVALMRWCLGQLNLPLGSTILDPYAGSGSTAVAAMQMGFRVIAIECNLGYIEVIRRRVRDAETPLFDAVRPEG